MWFRLFVLIRNKTFLLIQEAYAGFYFLFYLPLNRSEIISIVIEVYIFHINNSYSIGKKIIKILLI